MNSSIHTLYSVFIKNNALKWAVISLLNVIASLSEGLSFAVIYAAFMSLDKGVYPILKFLPFNTSSLETLLSNWQPNDIFLIFVFLGISLQVFRTLLVFIANNLRNSLQIIIQTKNQTKLLSKVLHFSYPFINSYRSGELIKALNSNFQFTQYVVEAITNCSLSFATCIILGALMIFISLKLTVSCCIAFIVVIAFKKGLINLIKKHSIKLSSKLDVITNYLFQSLNIIKSIQLQSKEEYFHTKVQDSVKTYAIYDKKVRNLQNIVNTTSEVSGIIVIALTLVIEILFFPETRASITVILSFISVGYRLSTRITIFFVSYSTIGFYSGMVEKHQSILTAKDSFIPTQGSLQPNATFQSLSLENIYFKYPGKNLYSLENISFSINKGERIALVGYSGAGKSSIINLLTRLYQSNQGTIKLDNTPIEKFMLKEWRQLFGVVTQEPSIFHASIKENILFGEKGISDEILIQAAKAAYAHEFISNLPDGYDTLIGENGIKLSGGERQRLALARVLLQNPPILLLDEATSNLDSYSESCIQKSISNLDKEKTIIFIAHRLSTIIEADKILVINKGRIQEVGTHSELLQQKGLYYSLWDLQNLQQNQPKALLV